LLFITAFYKWEKPLLLSLALFKEDIALCLCHWDLEMMVQLSTGHYFLNWHLTVRSFHYSLYVMCTLSWGRALEVSGLGSIVAHRRKERRKAFCTLASEPSRCFHNSVATGPSTRGNLATRWPKMHPKLLQT